MRRAIMRSGRPIGRPKCFKGADRLIDSIGIKRYDTNHIKSLNKYSSQEENNDGYCQ